MTEEQAEKIATDIVYDMDCGAYCEKDDVKTILDIQKALMAVYNQGRQDLLAKWPSEDETFAAASKYAHGDGESHENMFLAFVEIVKWLRERLGVV